ncbi:MAG: excinuclease ABC subunit C [Cycloclasticus sp. symbiont of Bathymodiolus heckerae]|nr:MAG: excinuclease ABC subunit C [Cycloclasticus sp. symbiont of Bathymodiolus heckerae]
MNKEAEFVAFDSEPFIKTLTQKPGVYQMIDRRDVCIYVGKAKNLKKRVSSYFNKVDNDAKKKVMLSHVQRIDIVVTHTEGEALLLENQLIKQLRPRYNICLRDDKSYPYIYLSSHQLFPCLSFHRGAKKGPGRYFGPYPSAGAVRDSLSILQKIFPVRQCDDSYYKNRSRPCLQYQIKRCTAPCVGLMTQQDYKDDVDHTVLFLEGKNNRLINGLVKKMEKSAEGLNFEKAAQFRDQISQLRKVMERQYVSGHEGDIDVIACKLNQGVACVQVFFIRGGQHLGNRTFFPKIPSGKTEQDVLSAFVLQFYLDKKLPKAIILSDDLIERELTQKVFDEKAERKVGLINKPRGERARWLKMALNNAETALKQQLESRENTKERLVKLSTLLEMGSEVRRMECFDISHLQGDHTVASCVVFDEEGPLKSDYRRFNIAGIEAGDDYAALAQATSRRFIRAKKKEHKTPDLLIIDGGKGQVSAVVQALKNIDCNDVFIIGISKGSDRKVGMEKIYCASNKKTLILPSDEHALLIIQQIRDEAHRFAISGHRQQRGKVKKKSTLEQIEGLGPKRRQLLLKQFGGLREIQAAGVDDLCTVDGINKLIAERVYDFFHDGANA